LTSSAHLPKFFITHSWRDNKFAKRLTDDLRAKGLQGFFDVYSIQPGDNIPSRISQGLEDCDVYIPILSEAAFSSPWCEWELGAAIQLRNTRGRMGRPRIIPVLIDHCEEKVPAILRPIAYVDFSDNYAQGLAKLVVRGMGVGNREAHAFQEPQPKRATLANANTILSQSGAHPLALIATIAVVVVSVVFGTLLVGGNLTTAVNPLTVQAQTSTSSSAVSQATPRTSATIASSKSSSASSALVILPTSIPTVPPPAPPASIDNPACPEPQFTGISFPMNGNVVSDIVAVRGNVVVHPFAQPYRYSLFYRPGIVREAIDSAADAQVPLSETSPNGRNIPIKVVVFQPFDAPINNDVLSSWDTRKLASGWYSLRLWSKDRGGNFMGCDVHVFVR
jgi:hypothetical protein